MDLLAWPAIAWYCPLIVDRPVGAYRMTPLRCRCREQAASQRGRRMGVALVAGPSALPDHRDCGHAPAVHQG